MNLQTKSIPERLSKYEFILAVAANDELLISLLTEYGYPITVIGKLQQQYDITAALHQDQKREYSEKLYSTQDFQKIRKEVFEKYVIFVKLARIALKNDTPLLTRLDLYGEREVNYDKMVGQMEAFFKGAMNEENVQNALLRFNVTMEKLQQSNDLFEQMKTKRSAQKKEKGEAQRATKDRDAAMKVLDDLMVDFIAVAKIALSFETQYMERLGFIDPS